MIILKSERDIEGMRAAGAVASAVLEDLCTWITPGITTEEIDCHASSCIKSRGAKSAFLGYRKYPCHVCLSVNEEVVHGLAGDRPVHFGDIVGSTSGCFIRATSGILRRQSRSEGVMCWRKN